MKRNPARRAALVAAALVVCSTIVPSLGTPAVAASPAGRLSGVVRDETGAALGGAEVRLSTPSGPVAGAGTTDAAGRYTISVATGLYDMAVTAGDAGGPWTAQVKNLSVWSDTPLDFAVVRPAAPAPPAATPTSATPTSATPTSAMGVTDGPAPGEALDVTWQGRIVGPDGGGVEPGVFSLEPAAGGAGGTLDVAGDGSFTFTGPAGRYDVSLATGLYPWGGGAESGPDDGLYLTGAVDLTADRADDLVLPEAAPADVVVAALDGRKRSDPLRYTAQRIAPVELAPGVAVTAAVSDTLAADGDVHYQPLLFGRSAVTFTVAGDPAPGSSVAVAVAATLEPRDRVAIVVGDRITPPGAPQDVTATPGDGKVKMTWAPPANDGGSPITGYVVTASHGGSTTKANVPASATSWSIKLFNGHQYSVTVAARNAKGLGAASAPLTVLLEGSPDTPPTTAPGNDPLGGAGSGDGDGTGTAPPGSGRAGYWLLGADGAVYAFGDAAPLGDASAALAAASVPSAGTTGTAVRAVDLESTPSGRGYWALDSRGRVHPFGDAGHFGDAGPIGEGGPIGEVGPARIGVGEAPASLSATPSGAGYWVFTNRGRALAFGDAAVLGDMAGTALNGPVLDSVATPSGRGYSMVASDGGIFAFGDARFSGSMGGRPLNAPVRSLVPDGDGAGYWLVAADGGVFAFDAPFRGSMGGRPLNKPVRGMVRYGDGYLMVGEDGGIFVFSDRPFTGSLGARPPAGPIVAVASL